MAEVQRESHPAAASSQPAPESREAAALAHPEALADPRLHASPLRQPRIVLANRLQRMAGNRAVGRILARNGTGTAPAAVHHKTGAEVDAMLIASTFFEPYIRPKHRAGLTADGHVNIHDQAAWDVMIVDYYRGKINPATGQRFRDEDEMRARGSRVNAVTDLTARQIHVHERRGEAATTVHESIHLFQDSGWLGAVGYNVNEGATEVFTKKLCAENAITRGNYYPDQYAAVKKLADRVGEKALADAYFNGKVGALKDRVDGTTGFFGTIGGWFRKSKWNAWVGHMQAGRYDDANDLM